MKLSGSVGLTFTSCALMIGVTKNDPTTPIDDADERQPDALDDDELQDVAAAGAERHADADLLRPLLDRVREHAVDADRGEDQRDAAEEREHPAEEEVLPVAALRAPPPSSHAWNTAMRGSEARIASRAGAEISAGIAGRPDRQAGVRERAVTRTTRRR